MSIPFFERCVPPPRHLVIAACSVAGWIVPTPGFADDLGCNGVRIRIEDSVETSWHQALRDACRQLGSEGNLDASADVHVDQLGDQLLIDVDLPDGRHAERRIGRERELGPTLEALLALPPQEARRPKPMPVAPVRADHAPVNADQTPVNVSPQPPASAFHLAVGGGVSTRLAGSIPYGAIGPVGFASFRSGRWLLDLAMRWEAVDGPIGDDHVPVEMQTVAVTFSIDRRVLQDGLTLDVGAGPSLVVETQSMNVDAVEKGGSETDVRIATHARLGVGEGALKWVFGLDGELAPSRLLRSRRVDESLPPLPAWSAGLLIGAMWSDE